MRRLLVGVVLGTLLVLGVAVGPSFSEVNLDTERGVAAGANPLSSAAPRIATPHVPPTQPVVSGGLITHVLPAESGAAAAIVVVEPANRVLAVYHIDRATGALSLKSVRNFTWDLQMVEYNSGEPLPQDIRNMRGELQKR